MRRDALRVQLPLIYSQYGPLEVSLLLVHRRVGQLAQLRLRLEHAEAVHGAHHGRCLHVVATHQVYLTGLLLGRQADRLRRRSLHAMQVVEHARVPQRHLRQLERLHAELLRGARLRRLDRVDV